MEGDDNHDGDHLETSNTSPLVPPPTQQIPHTVFIHQTPHPKKGEHYLSHTDYPIWQVIQNGNGHVFVITDPNGMLKVLLPKTAKEVVARERERKARTTSLMALLEDHLAKFHKMADAKKIFDDLYNNLRVFEHNVKGTTVSSSNTQNVTFVSAENTSSTNDVSTAYSVSSLSVLKSQKEGSSSYTDEVIHSFFANQSSAPQLDYDDLEQINDDDLEEMDLKWQGILQETIELKGTQRAEEEMVGTMETKLETMVEDLHIINSRSDNKVKSCSKACEESYARLKKLYDEQRDKLGDASIEIIAYTLALKKDDPYRALKDKGIVDSRCYMTGNKARLADYQEFKGGSVAFRGSNGRIAGKGKIKTSMFNFKDVYYMEELKHYNLFSVSQLKDLGYASTRKACFVCGSFIHLIKDCDFHEKRMAKQAELTKSKNKNKVLFTDTDCLVLSPDFKFPDENQVLLEILRQHNMYNFNVKNIDPSGYLACLFAKASIDESIKWHRRLGHVNFKNLNKLVKENLVRGLPSKIFKNDHTSVACQKQKQHKASCKAKIDETTPILKDFIRQAENQFNHKVKTIRSDNRTEIKNNDLIEFCGLKGIKRKYSNARTPQQNGVAERKNRTLIKAARTMVLVTKPQNKTPYELLTGKSNSGFLVGYSLNSKAFRVYNLKTNRVEENLHVNFLENKPNVAGKGHASMFDLDYLTNSMNYEYVLVENQVNKSAGPKEANNSACTQANDDQGANSAKIDLHEEHFVLPMWFAYSTTVKSSGNKIKKNTDFKTCEKPVSQVKQIFLEELEKLKRQEKEVNDAAESHRKEATHASTSSMVTDFNNLETTVSVSPTPTTRIHTIHPKTQILGDLMLAVQTRSKVNKNFEAHALASYIKSSKETIIRIFSIACLLVSYLKLNPKRYLKHWKIKVSTINEEVYVSQTPGFVDPKFPNKVYKVMKDLYGLHQAPRAWYANLSTFLKKSGYRRGAIDKTFFIKHDKKDIMLVQVYVDDIILGFTKKSLCDEFEELMKNRFQMSSMGELTFFLGLQVKQKEDGIFISQDKYVAKILNKFDFLSVKTASTPIKTQKPLVKNEEAADVDVHLYRSMIGSLMYLTASRPNIMFVVCACSRFQETYLMAMQKQTIVATSTIEEEYVATAHCCGQVL
nr:uncharacterized mitochondrial protein AtMg00810-like [Tanacetum cinerariifolium]